MQAEKAVLDITKIARTCFSEVAEILEKSPNFAGILTVHDKCLECDKAFQRTQESIMARMEVEHE